MSYSSSVSIAAAVYSPLSLIRRARLLGQSCVIMPEVLAAMALCISHDHMPSPRTPAFLGPTAAYVAKKARSLHRALGQCGLDTEGLSMERAHNIARGEIKKRMAQLAPSPYSANVSTCSDD